MFPIYVTKEAFNNLDQESLYKIMDNVLLCMQWFSLSTPGHTIQKLCKYAR